MGKTKIEDILIPDVWEKVFIERTATQSNLVSSGIIESSDDFNARASGGGIVIDMPFFQDLSGARQILSDSASLSVNKIGQSEDKACINNDANAWSVNLLANLLSGSDPMAAIATLVGDYWMRTDQATLLSQLKGVFAAASMSGNLLNIASETIGGQGEATKLTGLTFIDALQKLGDRKDRITSVIMHSATHSALQKRDLIDTIPDSQGKNIEFFMGRRVIVDDTMPTRAGTTDGTVYRTYMFGPGAFAKGNANLSAMKLAGGHGDEGVEYARVPLDSDNVLINRRRYILHPRGVQWTSSSQASNAGPTNAEFETSANWIRKFEAKNVRLIAVDHNN